MNDSSLGLYIHVPFCKKRCAYCDFYSSFVTEELLDRYTNSVISYLKEWGGVINRPINTIYFGGGTPSLLSSRIITIMESVHKYFKIVPDAEVTLEANPSGDVKHLLECAKYAGINRLSIGAQSGSDKELKILGRTHSANDTKETVAYANELGFDNISLDIMIGLPDSDKDSLKKSLNFICNLNPSHISSYILKVEQNTAFYKLKEKLNFPDNDMQAEQYMIMCDYLRKNGYEHYEISNFCISGYESKHNLKYWNDEEYIGIGPSAHSFLGNKRFYYPSDLHSFLNKSSPVFESYGGDEKEYIMLRLRLGKGLYFNETQKRIGKDIPISFFKLCKELSENGLALCDNERISLTDSGMLVSNTIIIKLLECL